MADETNVGLVAVRRIESTLQIHQDFGFGEGGNGDLELCLSVHVYFSN